MKIIFMGTSDFAVPALEAIAKSDHEIIAVYCRPPAKAGRGHKLVESPLHKKALKLGYDVFHPKSLRKEEVQKEIKSFCADVIVVSAYGNILPKEVLEACPNGCLNIHPSLLPRWRGAAPVERTILAGDEKTAICIMQMDEGLDTGDILLQKEMSLNHSHNSETLRKLTSEISGEMIVEALNNIDNLMPIKQSEDGVTYAEKLNKEEGLIDWQNTCRQIDQQIRAFYPWPGSYFFHEGEQIKILEADYIEKNHGEEPGTIVDDKLSIACKDGIIEPKILQRPGKKAMQLKDMLNGFKIAKGTKIDG